MVVRFNPKQGTLTDGTRGVRLTGMQSAILAAVCRHKGDVVHHEQMAAEIYPYPDSAPLNARKSVGVQIMRIRRAAARVRFPALIRTVPWRGYAATGAVEIETLRMPDLTMDQGDELLELIDTHPNTPLADRVRAALFGH